MAITGTRKPRGSAPPRPREALRDRAARIDLALERRYGRPRLRRSRDLVGMLVRTILSQNTSDINSARGFRRLRDRFASWAAVRDASLVPVVDAIRPAGLGVLKAPRIQGVLRRITQERGNLSLGFLRRWPVPRAKAWLRSLAGVGPKTAAIVLVFGLGRPAFAVDTHVYRVAGRLGLIPESMTVDAAHDWMEVLVPPRRYGPFHLLLVRHGREVCKAGRPRCEVCVVRRWCDFYRAGGATRRR